MAQFEELIEIIDQGQTNTVCSCIQALLDQGFTPEQIVQNGVMPALQSVGSKFETQEIFIPQMLIAARTVNLGNEYLRSRMPVTSSKVRRKVLLGTVKDDLHYIGKNLVAAAMRSVGIEVVDLGVDAAPEQFVKAAEEDPEIAVVGVSSLLTITLPAMRKTVKALKNCKAADRIHIMVGGGPVTEEFAKSLGVIYTETAFEAAQTARKLLSEKEDSHV